MPTDPKKKKTAVLHPEGHDRSVPLTPAKAEEKATPPAAKPSEPAMTDIKRTGIPRNTPYKDYRTTAGPVEERLVPPLPDNPDDYPKSGVIKKPAEVKAERGGRAGGLPAPGSPVPPKSAVTVPAPTMPKPPTPAVAPKPPAPGTPAAKPPAPAPSPSSLPPAAPAAPPPHPTPPPAPVARPPVAPPPAGGPVDVAQGKPSGQDARGPGGQAGGGNQAPGVVPAGGPTAQESVGQAEAEVTPSSVPMGWDSKPIPKSDFQPSDWAADPETQTDMAAVPDVRPVPPATPANVSQPTSAGRFVPSPQPTGYEDGRYTAQYDHAVSGYGLGTATPNLAGLRDKIDDEHEGLIDPKVPRSEQQRKRQANDLKALLDAYKDATGRPLPGIRRDVDALFPQKAQAAPASAAASPTPTGGQQPSSGGQAPVAPQAPPAGQPVPATSAPPADSVALPYPEVGGREAAELDARVKADPEKMVPALGKLLDRDLATLDGMWGGAPRKSMIEHVANGMAVYRANNGGVPHPAEAMFRRMYGKFVDGGHISWPADDTVSPAWHGLNEAPGESAPAPVSPPAPTPVPPPAAPDLAGTSPPGTEGVTMRKPGTPPGPPPAVVTPAATSSLGRPADRPKPSGRVRVAIPSRLQVRTERARPVAAPASPPAVVSGGREVVAQFGDRVRRTLAARGMTDIEVGGVLDDLAETVDFFKGTAQADGRHYVKLGTPPKEVLAVLDIGPPGRPGGGRRYTLSLAKPGPATQAALDEQAKFGPTPVDDGDPATRIDESVTPVADSGTDLDHPFGSDSTPSSPSGGAAQLVSPPSGVSSPSGTVAARMRVPLPVLGKPISPDATGEFTPAAEDATGEFPTATEESGGLMPPPTYALDQNLWRLDINTPGEQARAKALIDRMIGAIGSGEAKDGSTVLIGDQPVKVFAGPSGSSVQFPDGSKVPYRSSASPAAQSPPKPPGAPGQPPLTPVNSPRHLVTIQRPLRWLNNVLEFPEGTPNERRDIPAATRIDSPPKGPQPVLVPKDKPNPTTPVRRVSVGGPLADIIRGEQPPEPSAEPVEDVDALEDKLVALAATPGTPQRAALFTANKFRVGLSSAASFVSQSATDGMTDAEIVDKLNELSRPTKTDWTEDDVRLLRSVHGIPDLSSPRRAEFDYIHGGDQPAEPTSTQTLPTPAPDAGVEMALQKFGRASYQFPMSPPPGVPRPLWDEFQTLRNRTLRGEFERGDTESRKALFRKLWDADGGKFRPLLLPPARPVMVKGGSPKSIRTTVPGKPSAAPPPPPPAVTTTAAPSPPLPDPFGEFTKAMRSGQVPRDPTGFEAWKAKWLADKAAQFGAMSDQQLTDFLAGESVKGMLTDDDEVPEGEDAPIADDARRGPVTPANRQDKIDDLMEQLEVHAARRPTVTPADAAPPQGSARETARAEAAAQAKLDAATEADAERLAHEHRIRVKERLDELVRRRMATDLSVPARYTKRPGITVRCKLLGA